MLPKEYLYMIPRDEEIGRAASALADAAKAALYDDEAAAIYGMAAALDPAFAEGASAAWRGLLQPGAAYEAVLGQAAAYAAAFRAARGRQGRRPLEYLRFIIRLARYSAQADWLGRLAKAVIDRLREEWGGEEPPHEEEPLPEALPEPEAA